MRQINDSPHIPVIAINNTIKVLPIEKYNFRLNSLATYTIIVYKLYTGFFFVPAYGFFENYKIKATM